MTNFLCHYADLEFKKSKGDNEDFGDDHRQRDANLQVPLQLDAFLKMYQKLLTMRILNDQFKNRDYEIELIKQTQVWRCECPHQDHHHDLRHRPER